MCWGPCAGAHVLGPMCWGPCAGAHVLGPMCSWTSPARNICDEKSDEKVKFCRRLPKYRPHRELYAPSKVPPRCRPPSQKGQSCGGKKSEKKVKLRAEKRQTSTKTSGEISRLSEILRAVQSSPEMQPNWNGRQKGSSENCPSRTLPKYGPHRELYAPSKVPPRCPPPSEKGHFSQGVLFTRPHSPVGTTIAVSKKIDYGHADNLSTLRLVRLLFRFPRTPKPYRDAPLPPNTRIKKGVGKREFRFDFFGTASEILKNSSSSATCVFLKTQVYHCFGGEGGFRYSFAAILSKKTCLNIRMYEGRFLFSLFFCMKNVARVW